MSYWDEVARKSWNERHSDGLELLSVQLIKEVTVLRSKLSCKLILSISAVIVLLLSHFSRLFFSIVITLY